MAEKTATAGNELFEEVATLTGLPREQITVELTRILKDVGSTPENVTLEELRRATAMLLVEVMNGEAEK
ncbi:MAG: hypothetical protein HYW49_10250 [Deltaproteobacteria bacterium]|nr:hypothetical protein [Deltaproteobacteria bacterium]